MEIKASKLQIGPPKPYLVFDISQAWDKASIGTKPLFSECTSEEDIWK